MIKDFYSKKYNTMQKLKWVIAIVFIFLPMIFYMTMFLAPGYWYSSNDVSTIITPIYILCARKKNQGKKEGNNSRQIV